MEINLFVTLETALSSFLVPASDEPASRPLVITSIQFLTADLPGAGMTGGGALGGVGNLFGVTGKFSLTVSGDRGTCRTGYLDDEENNWQRGRVDTFDGQEVGECDRFDAGQSEASAFPLEIVLEHEGSNGGHLEWARINDEAGEAFQCKIQEKLDNDDKRSYQCKRMRGGLGKCWNLLFLILHQGSNFHLRRMDLWRDQLRPVGAGGLWRSPRDGVRADRWRRQGVARHLLPRPHQPQRDHILLRGGRRQREPKGMEVYIYFPTPCSTNFFPCSHFLGLPRPRGPPRHPQAGAPPVPGWSEGGAGGPQDLGGGARSGARLRRSRVRRGGRRRRIVFRGDDDRGDYGGFNAR